LTVAPAPPELPDLRVVSLESLVLHEEADARRVGLLQRRFVVEQIVKNPPVVAPMSAGRFVVLDGANRIAAMRALGLPDAVVQVVDYDTVELTTWFHLVVGMSPDDFLATVASASDGRLGALSQSSARSDLEAGRIAVYLVDPGGGFFGVQAPSDLAARVTLLKALVATYSGQCDIHRVQTDAMSTLRSLYTELAGLVVFPPYGPGDILTLAEHDVKLPTGITRHVIPRRALRLNTDIDFLWGDSPLAEKNRWLSEWTRHKLQSREIRYYEESTFLFDE